MSDIIPKDPFNHSGCWQSNYSYTNGGKKNDKKSNKKSNKTKITNNLKRKEIKIIYI